MSGPNEIIFRFHLEIVEPFSWWQDEATMRSWIRLLREYGLWLDFEFWGRSGSKKTEAIEGDDADPNTSHTISAVRICDQESYEMLRAEWKVLVQLMDHIEVRRAVLDLTSSGQAAQTVTQLVVDGTIIANACGLRLEPRWLR